MTHVYITKGSPFFSGFRRNPRYLVNCSRPDRTRLRGNHLDFPSCCWIRESNPLQQHNPDEFSDSSRLISPHQHFIRTMVHTFRKGTV